MSSVVAMLAACVAPAPPVMDSAAGAGDITIPEWVEGSAIVPIWSAEQAVATVEATLAKDFPSPFVIRAALNTYFEHGDAGCPGEGTMMAGPSFEGCTSGEGWYYLGVGGYTDIVYEDEHGPFVELTLMGDLTLIDPEGAEFDIGGHWITQLHDQGPAWRSFINGTWLQPASSAEWLSGGMSAWLDYAGSVSEAGPTVYVNGGLSVDGVTLGFTSLVVGAPGCGAVPTGAVDVLDPGGGRWSVDFGVDCSPCGTLTFEGVAVESDACLDLGVFGDRLLDGVTP